tara:strand:+ start:1138 stop:3429 length:2292 start_codon:yes stop_codon:yes gene_type:complete
MPIYSPTGFLDITNATLRTSNTECQNLQIGTGNVFVTTEITSNALLDLENITILGNSAANTIQLTNTTVGLVATGNVHASKFIGDGSFLNLGSHEDLLDNASRITTLETANTVQGGLITAIENTTIISNSSGLTSGFAKGDIVYASANNILSNLAIGGTTGHVLKVSSTGIPEWAAESGGGGSSGSTEQLVSYTSDPASANAGAVYFNTTDNVVRFYNGSVWWSVAPIPPSITNISPSTFGGQIGELFTITGAEFDVNTTVIFKGADSTEYASAVVTFISSSQITATNATTLPVSNEPYKIKVTSATGTITSFQTIDSGTLPTFTTASGQISSNAWNVPVSTAVLASDTETSIASYSIVTGVLPTGLSINTSTGAITGTPIEQNSTTYTFTVQALDTAGNATTRQFNIQIINGTPVWSVPAAAGSITIYINEAATGSNAVTLTATDPEGSAVVYSTSNTLPTGLNLVGNTITGTPTVLGSYPLTINASDGYTSAPRNFTLLVGRPVHSSKGLTGAQGFTLRTRFVAKDMNTGADTTVIPSGANPKNPAGNMTGSTLPTGTVHRWADWNSDIFDNWGRWYIYDTSTGSASYIQFGTLNGADGTVYTETQTHHSKTFTIIHGWVVEGIFKLDVECSDDTFQFSIGMYGNMGADGGNTNSDHQYTASWGKLSYNFNRDGAISDPLFIHFIPKQVTFNAGITLSGTNFTTNLNTGTVSTTDNMYVWSDPLEIGAIMYFVKALPAVGADASLTIEQRSMAEWVANDIN